MIFSPGIMRRSLFFNHYRSIPLFYISRRDNICMDEIPGISIDLCYKPVLPVLPRPPILLWSAAVILRK